MVRAGLPRGGTQSRLTTSDETASASVNFGMSNSDDIPRLAAQAYHRATWGAPLCERYRSLEPRLRGLVKRRLKVLYEWFLMPVTFWPLNLHDALTATLSAVESTGKIAPEMAILIDLLPAFPSPSAVTACIAHEHDVQNGRYEHLVPASGPKFAATERKIAADPRYQSEWRRITRTFNVQACSDAKGLIRRRLVQERSMRGEFSFRWDDESERFQEVFDVFCAKWNLYGTRRGRPLVLKLSVNLTPHGTLIFIPAYWSFDARRDIDWAEVAALHRSRGQRRQGQALAEGDAERRRSADKLKRLLAAAKERKLRGARRHEFLCRGLGWDPRTDPKRVTRLIKEFRLESSSQVSKDGR